MARKFFNQKVSGSSNKTIAYAIVGGVLVAMVIFIFMVVFTNQSDAGDPIIEIRDLVTVEVNSELPDKTLFFAELQNVDEDDINISFADVGYILNINDEMNLSYDYYIYGVENPNIEFHSSDNSIVNVDENGHIIALANGQATITASYGDISSDIQIFVGSDSYLIGDVNQDKAINSIDASMVIDIYKNNTGDALLRILADVNGDGAINALDSSLIIDIYKKND